MRVVGDALAEGGGLRPENVGEAIARVRPWGVDVSSGVEAAPGVKDPLKLRAFFEAIAHVEPAGVPAATTGRERGNRS